MKADVALVAIVAAACAGFVVGLSLAGHRPDHAQPVVTMAPTPTQTPFCPVVWISDNGTRQVCDWAMASGAP